MDKLEQYRVFIQVADMGSFIKAAHVLELPRATVSSAVQQLETGLGTRLLHRTTRHVQLTADGAILLERARRLLADASELSQLFQHRQVDVSGRLNIDVPSRIARRLIVPALPQWLAQYPDLQLALGACDRSIDLVQEGIDCAIRVGSLADSSLIARPLGRLALINCASPAYLAEHGEPRSHQDLQNGQWMVGYASPDTGREQPWEYLQEGREHLLGLPSRVIVNNVENYIACCRQGLGLIQVPRFDVQHLLERGELVQVLHELPVAPMEISALYPDRRHRSRRLNVFIEWFAELIKPHLEA
ncbi:MULTISPECIES: LysR family transcriptional regulator [Pseudomonas]|uniref:LysR family transcriptional regulator n=1 Tax=Pseudomonas idahonensis TaxID=2942628 RepID=A0ABT5Q5D2_9PSED|nr:MULTISPECIES: LysR family transcriptional regulator [Pseudomonas]MBS7561589.1 LysR family transcriptional regulator [Pseudomonas sp. RC4D1]MBW8357549.1 LysR family transcriptional regulator [Pseudomonas sp.]MCO7577923.1 LysR family transcriptional regulator [Pseudomonas protegens]MCO7584298.1 LysR family transcriptional regulator [Pseudomonas chlororaphis]MCO7601306.1 LysR family transcriptional regulator [Pseudomonas chlororaphis]